MKDVVAACAILVAMAFPGIAAGEDDSPPRIAIIEPGPDRVAVGPTSFRIEPWVAPGRRIRIVRFFVDGRLIGSQVAPPWELSFDAGDRFASHTLRAEIEDDLGRIAADFGTTLYLGYIEEVAVETTGLQRFAIQVGVLDRHRQPLPGLPTDAFTLHVDGRRESIVSVTPEDGPLAVELLLDVSGSTLPYLEQIRGAADLFLGRLDESDGTEITFFAGNAIRVVPFSRSHERSRARLQRVNHGLAVPGLRLYGSRLYDALATAVEAINVQPGQRSIAVFTDTFDTGSALSYDQVAEVIRRANIRVDLIRFGRSPAGNWSQSNRLVKRMRTLAADSGGREWRIVLPEDIEPSFAQLARQLKLRYRIVFSPEPPRTTGRYRKLKVKVDRSGATVLAPRGYIHGERSRR